MLTEEQIDAMHAAFVDVLNDYTAPRETTRDNTRRALVAAFKASGAAEALAHLDALRGSGRSIEDRMRTTKLVFVVKHDQPAASRAAAWLFQRIGTGGQK